MSGSTLQSAAASLIVVKEQSVLIRSGAGAVQHANTSSWLYTLSELAKTLDCSLPDEIIKVADTELGAVGLISLQDVEIDPVFGEFVNLRKLMSELSEETIQLFSRALQLNQWELDHRYCGRCGTKTHRSAEEYARHCSACNLSVFPRISPCVIGAVYTDTQILLGRAARFPEGLYSTFAGFVEVGETAEQAFARELDEEAGVELANIAYLSSQSWPFPGQLMLGFKARYRSGEARADGIELEDVRWFDFDKLPPIPPPYTISGRIIRDILKEGLA